MRTSRRSRCCQLEMKPAPKRLASYASCAKTTNQTSSVRAVVGNFPTTFNVFNHRLPPARSEATISQVRLYCFCSISSSATFCLPHFSFLFLRRARTYSAPLLHYYLAVNIAKSSPLPWHLFSNIVSVRVFSALGCCLDACPLFMSAI
jgi:hypothetical protein